MMKLDSDKEKREKRMIFMHPKNHEYCKSALLCGRNTRQLKTKSSPDPEIQRFRSVFMHFRIRSRQRNKSSTAETTGCALKRDLGGKKWRRLQPQDS